MLLFEFKTYICYFFFKSRLVVNQMDFLEELQVVRSMKS